MARPNKNNIGTFPFDVDFFDNKIIVRINGEFGAKGIIIVVKLLCAVYEQGYFLKWSIDEQYLMKRYLSGISVELIDQVLQRLLKWDFFNNDLFKSDKILTSVEIQRNYFNAIKRRSIIHSNSFPYLLLNPQRPNDVSAYKNGINVCNNDVSVNNNKDYVAEMAINVNGGYNSGYNNPVLNSSQNKEFTPEKEFLHTKTGVSAYKNPDNCINNPDFGNEKDNSAYKNPLDEHFATKRELLHTETGVSVNNNQGFCMQKPNGVKNNNPQLANNQGENVGSNPNNVSNNGEKDNNNGSSDSNNRDNIIYSSISSNNNYQSNSSNQEVLQNLEIGKQKGKQSLQELESDLKDFLNDEIWIDGFCKNHDIQKSQLPELLEKFKIECISSGKISHIDYQDTKKHFHNWLRIYLQQSQNISKTYGSQENRQNKNIQRRGTEANSKKQKNYHATL